MLRTQRLIASSFACSFRPQKHGAWIQRKDTTLPSCDSTPSRTNKYTKIYKTELCKAKDIFESSQSRQALVAATFRSHGRCTGRRADRGVASCESCAADLQRCGGGHGEGDGGAMPRVYPWLTFNCRIWLM